MSKQRRNETESTSQPQCVTLWQHAKSLCAQGIESLWERTKILCELVEDEDFLRRFIQADEAIADIFQREVLWDTTITFAELRTVWEYCDDSSAWHEKGIATLLDEATEANAKDSAGERNRVSWKAKAAQLQEEVEQLQCEISELRRENAELRRLIAQPVGV